MARAPIPSFYFALVVVRRSDEFLLVHERKHGQLWYLPAGRVEAGESFQSAAERETLEEGGIQIRVNGIVRVEHTPSDVYTRVRVIFTGEPLDDTPPKQVADDESLGAAWVKVKDLGRYPLRGTEVKDLLEYVEDGAPIYPVELIQLESAPYREA